jgi:hypothetical protein
MKKQKQLTPKQQATMDAFLQQAGLTRAPLPPAFEKALQDARAKRLDERRQSNMAANPPQDIDWHHPEPAAVELFRRT